MLYAYLTDNKLLNPKNAGFKKGDGTVNQLLYITDKISSGLDQGRDTRMVFLDAAKAFDKVWHKGLLFKLRQLGIAPDFVNWFDSYLSHRKQRVVLNSFSSSLLSIDAWPRQPKGNRHQRAVDQWNRRHYRNNLVCRQGKRRRHGRGCVFADDVR